MHPRINMYFSRFIGSHPAYKNLLILLHPEQCPPTGELSLTGWVGYAGQPLPRGAGGDGMGVGLTSFLYQLDTIMLDFNPNRIRVYTEL